MYRIPDSHLNQVGGRADEHPVPFKVPMVFLSVCHALGSCCFLVIDKHVLRNADKYLTVSWVISPQRAWELRELLICVCQLARDSPAARPDKLLTSVKLYKSFLLGASR